MTQAEGPGGAANPLSTNVQYRVLTGEIISAEESPNMISATYEKASAAGDPEPDPAT
jgi:hypothetical protein